MAVAIRVWASPKVLEYPSTDSVASIFVIACPLQTSWAMCLKIRVPISSKVIVGLDSK